LNSVDPDAPHSDSIIDFQFEYLFRPTRNLQFGLSQSAFSRRIGVMTRTNDKDSRLSAFKTVRRQLVRLSPEGLVTADYLNDERLPLVLRPNTNNVDLFGWVENNRDYIEKELGKHGAILFRGFNVSLVVEFERFVRAVSGKILEYNERSSPRSQISGEIYTSTDYPSDKRIFLHNEQSYNMTFPMKIFFFCAKAPETAGATPIADTRKIFNRITDEIRARFMEKKYLYARNFGDGFGLNWQEVFQTERRSEVERYCRHNQIEYEWKAGDRLRTKQVRRVARTHPKTGEWAWFNHLTFFHVTTLDRQIQAQVLKEFAEEDLPNNTYYGDGARIEDEVMKHLRVAYEQEKVRFDWEEGDILMLDNMLVAHGREPYTGERRIAVGMADAWNWNWD
jgi:alpha-ketoglutarate-dependent taurine dioxygenase